MYKINNLIVQLDLFRILGAPVVFSPTAQRCKDNHCKYTFKQTATAFITKKPCLVKHLCLQNLETI